MRDIDLMKVMDSKPLHKSGNTTAFVCKSCRVYSVNPKRVADRLTCASCGGDVEVFVDKE